VIISCWSPVGGAGTTTVVVALAHGLASTTPVRVVDLAGAVPAVAGLPDDGITGVADWLRVGADAPAGALGSVAVAAAERLDVLPRGAATLPLAADPDAVVLAGVFIAALRRGPGIVVLDAGRADAPLTESVVAASDVRVVVVPTTYVALRCALRDPLVAGAHAMVVVDDQRGTVPVRAVERVLDREARAVVPRTRAIANVVDAGVVLTRPPEGLARGLRPVVRWLDALAHSRALHRVEGDRA
jgi:cellulose biosynthesis protein BcsQ